jgi:hypothetical protein
MARLVMVGLLAAVAVAPALARADREEWRIGAGGGAMVVEAHVGGADGTGLGYEAHARLGYGLSNTFELGLVGGYAHAADVEVDGATLEGQTGQLFTNLSTVSLAVELRWTPGIGVVRAFERTGPYLTARTGGALVVRTSQQLFTATGLLLLDQADDLRFTVLAGGAVGIEHRFGDHLFVAGELSVSVGHDQRLFAMTAEAAWAWY